MFTLLESEVGPFASNCFSRLTQADKNYAAMSPFKSRSLTQLPEKKESTFQSLKSQFDSLGSIGNELCKMSCKSVKSRVNLSSGTYVVTDSWPQAPLKPTTSTGTPSNYGVDPHKLKYPDPQVTWNMCSRSPPPPPGFAAINADRMAQPLPWVWCI